MKLKIPISTKNRNLILTKDSQSLLNQNNCSKQLEQNNINTDLFKHNAPKFFNAKPNFDYLKPNSNTSLTPGNEISYKKMKNLQTMIDGNGDNNENKENIDYNILANHNSQKNSAYSSKNTKVSSNLIINSNDKSNYFNNPRKNLVNNSNIKVVEPKNVKITNHYIKSQNEAFVSMMTKNKITSSSNKDLLNKSNNCLNNLSNSNVTSSANNTNNINNFNNSNRMLSKFSSNNDNKEVKYQPKQVLSSKNSQKSIKNIPSIFNNNNNEDASNKINTNTNNFNFSKYNNNTTNSTNNKMLNIPKTSRNKDSLSNITNTVTNKIIISNSENKDSGDSNKKYYSDSNNNLSSNNSNNNSSSKNLTLQVNQESTPFNNKSTHKQPLLMTTKHSSTRIINTVASSTPQNNHINNNFISNRSSINRINSSNNIEDSKKLTDYTNSISHTTILKTEVSQSNRNLNNKNFINPFNSKPKETKEISSTNNSFKPILEKVKISNSNYGVVQAYSASTNQGNVRNYNEDRVSIILNINKPSKSTIDNWPKCSFFGIYDGHAGSLCADFLRDNLHKYIINDSNFPFNPQKAILNGFLQAERVFLEYSLSSGCIAGSCAIVILIIENKCYIANLGDSRALMSGNFGEKAYVLSRDHRPGDEKEYKRIIDAGGKIYQTEANIVSKDRNESILGPLRIKPGKLSVSRTVGDIEAKLPQFGGNPNVIIGVPEIKYFELNDNYDFILLGCDGVFDKFKNKEIISVLWERMNNSNATYSSLHEMTGDLSGHLIKEVLRRESTDNLTVVVIALNGLKSHYNNAEIIQNTAQTAQLVKKQKSSFFSSNSANNSNNINNNVNIKHKTEIQEVTNNNSIINNANTSSSRNNSVSKNSNKEINLRNENNNNNGKGNSNNIEFKVNPALFSFSKKNREDEDIYDN